MPGHQVRIAEEVFGAARKQRRALGFAADAPIGTVVSELARDGIEFRLLQQRQQERASVYAAWAGDDELHDDVLQTARWALEAGGV